MPVTQQGRRQDSGSLLITRAPRDLLHRSGGMAVPTPLSEYPWLREEPNQGGLLVQRVSVRWEVPVHFTRDAFSWENLSVVRALARRVPGHRLRILFVIERAVAEAHPNLLDDVSRYVAVHRERLTMIAEPIVVRGGCAALLDDAVDLQLRRAIGEIDRDPSAVTVAIGGAAFQELVSRARPIRHLRIPTSAQSQIEAALARPPRGAGYGPPLAVIDDFDFLETTPPSSATAGLALAIATALAHDPSFFGWLRLHASMLASHEPATLAQLVRRAAQHAPAEPMELGAHPTLDLGQWVGSVLSALTRGELPRGAALAIGCAVDVVHSAARGLLDADALDPIVSTIEALGLPTYHPALDRPGMVERLAAMRETAGGYTLLDSIGHAVETEDFDEQLVLRAIDWLRHRVPPSRR